MPHLYSIPCHGVFFSIFLVIMQQHISFYVSCNQIRMICFIPKILLGEVPNNRPTDELASGPLVALPRLIFRLSAWLQRAQHTI